MTFKDRVTKGARALGSFLRSPIQFQAPITRGATRQDLEDVIARLRHAHEVAEFDLEVANDHAARDRKSYEDLLQAVRAVQPKEVGEAALYDLVTHVIEIRNGDTKNIDLDKVAEVRAALEHENYGRDAQRVVLDLANNFAINRQSRFAVPLYEIVASVAPEHRNDEVYYLALAGRVSETIQSVSHGHKEKGPEAIRALLEADPALAKVKYDVDRLSAVLHEYAKRQQKGNGETELLYAIARMRKVADGSTVENEEKAIGWGIDLAILSGVDLRTIAHIQRHHAERGRKDLGNIAARSVLYVLPQVSTLTEQERVRMYGEVIANASEEIYDFLLRTDVAKADFLKAAEYATPEDQGYTRAFNQLVVRKDPTLSDPEMKAVAAKITKPYFDGPCEKNGLDWFVNASLYLANAEDEPSTLTLETVKYSLYMALKADISLTDATIKLGEFYRGRNKTLAQAVYGELVKHDPNNPTAKEALAALN